MTQNMLQKALVRWLDVVGRRWLSTGVPAVLAIPLVVWAQPVTSVTLTVEADEASRGMGVVKVALWRDEKTFLKGEPYRGATIEMKDGKATATFPDLEPGEYAVSAFHDKNSNGRLDTNFTGKPTEPYGFSNDARGRFGPPKFENARFRVNNSRTIIIQLN
jgi:uncharacterized protein (DUF2141 family)